MSRFSARAPQTVIPFAEPSPTRSPGAVVRRRWAFLALAGAIVAGMVALMAATLSPGGFGWTDLLLTVLFALTLPWTVIGFLNGLIGLVIMRTCREPALAVCPLEMPPPSAPLRASTALTVCIRNEDVAAVTRNLERMLADLESRGSAERFHAYVISDTDDPETAEHEARVFGNRSRRSAGRIPVSYRRRTDNSGYKAGNIRDFLERWGDRHEFMLVLDADSVMTAEAITRLVRVMQANPRLGILQSLIVGLPATSGFARIFQFGMRLGMRSYTIGSAWWQGDCGPYWGHNALIRIAPFRAHCELPRIPGSGPLRGPILSHDQVEAVLMRRAGWEVRVLPDATGSFEENPPSLVEFVRRDLRWCLGNTQYLHLLRLPGLRPVSRMQLVLAILMFAGSPAWMAFAALGGLRVGLADDPTATFDPDLGLMLFAAVLGMVFAPKIATVIDLLLDREARRTFGGAARIMPGVVGEIVFSTLLAPIMAIAHTRLLAGLPFGRKASWTAQTRGAHRVGAGEALGRFWPQCLAGAVALAWIGGYSAAPLWSVLPLALGPLLVVPFTVFTASVTGTRLITATGLWRIPEERAPPPVLAAVTATRDHDGPAALHGTAVGPHRDAHAVVPEPLPALATSAVD